MPRKLTGTAVNYRSPNAANIITSTMYDGGTLSFDSTSGQLFSITDSLTGSIFSVNDISGIPSVEVFDTGEVRLAQYSGNVGLGIANATAKLHVVGTANITANVIVNGGTFFVDTVGNEVGIGTTTPTSNLHVIGTANITAGIVAGGNTNFDSGTLFVDSINNRVGVGGLTAPVKELDVIGSIQSNSAIFTSASQIRLKTSSGTSGYGVIHRHDGSDYYTLITNNNDANGNWNGFRPFSIQLSSGNIYLGNTSLSIVHGATTGSGSVGIGTSSPVAKLSVSGNANTPLIALPDATNSRYSVALGSTNVFGAGQRLDFYTGDSGTNGTNLSNANIRMSVTATGNVGIGTINPTYKLEVNGSFAATTKSFVIDHPTKSGMKLRHGSLEGPENGVYVRGKLTGNIIELPDYWTGLVDSESITVNLTPIGKYQKLFVEKIENNKVYVASEDWFGKINCYYTVFAERKDVEKLAVEY